MERMLWVLSTGAGTELPSRAWCGGGAPFVTVIQVSISLLRDSCFHRVCDAVNQGLALCVRMLGFQTCDTLNRQYSQWSAGQLSFPQASSSSSPGCGAKDGQRMKSTSSYTCVRKWKQLRYQEVFLGAH